MFVLGCYWQWGWGSKGEPSYVHNSNTRWQLWLCKLTRGRSMILSSGGRDGSQCSNGFSVSIGGMQIPESSKSHDFQNLAYLKNVGVCKYHCHTCTVSTRWTYVWFQNVHWSTRWFFMPWIHVLSWGVLGLSVVWLHKPFKCNVR